MYVGYSESDTDTRSLGKWEKANRGEARERVGDRCLCSCIIEFKPALQLNNKIGKVTPSILQGGGGGLGRDGGIERSQLANYN